MKTWERFLEYVAYDTQSKPDADTYPSTEKQWLLANRLEADLREMRIPAEIDPFGYVIGTLSGNVAGAPRMALIAHIDTSPDASGTNVRPRFVHSYDGGTIVLEKETGIQLSPMQFPALKKQVGHDLIVTDGTTLLGADDKAGVAEIMTIAAEIAADPTIPHGDLVFVFTPDEEVGNGTDHLDLSKVPADLAYTLDGSAAGEIAYENFNAAAATVTILGKSVHPGSAKNAMINALMVAMEFDSLLPLFERPEITENYEGFHHLHGMEGNCEKSVMKYLIRNHDRETFERHKQDFSVARDFLNNKYGYEICRLEIKDSYYNMREKIEPVMHIVDWAVEAIREVGLTPRIEPIRGGTDGARLTFLGLPCPNLGTGGYNFHGPYEYVSVQEMDQSVEILRRIIAKVAKTKK